MIPTNRSAKTAAFYNGRCESCHRDVAHKVTLGSRGCVECHMPQVATSRELSFTNHWIGIYDQAGSKLIPTRRGTSNAAARASGGPGAKTLYRAG